MPKSESDLQLPTQMILRCIHLLFAGGLLVSFELSLQLVSANSFTSDTLPLGSPRPSLCSMFIETVLLVLIRVIGTTRPLVCLFPSLLYHGSRRRGEGKTY